MNSVLQKVEQLILPLIAELGLELVDIEYQRGDSGWVLRVYLDKHNGINLDDCAAASREISTLLDVEDIVATAYSLEVSSPGLERPLKKLDDFKRFVGKAVKIKTCRSCDPDGRGTKRKVFVGQLQAVNDGQISLLLTDKLGGEAFIDFDEIDKANLVFEF